MKKRYIFLYIIISMLIAILIINIYTIKNDKSKNVNDYGYIDNSQFYEDKIFPDNIEKIVVGYDGNKDLVELYKGIYQVAKVYIPKLNSLNTEEQLEIYYQKNAEEVSKNIGINTYEELKEFYKKVYINKSSFQYSSSEIVLDTVKVTNNNIIFDLKIIYNKNDVIVVSVNFPKIESKTIKFL